MAEGLPLELVVLEFPQPEVPEAVDVALSRLTFLGDLKVLEAAAVVKGDDGTWATRDVDHLVSSPGDGGAPPAALVPAELDRIGGLLQPGHSALALVVAHTWINELAGAFRKGGGAVLRSAWLNAN